MGSKRIAIIVVGTLSVLVPALVAVLIFLPYKFESDQDWIRGIPGFNASINSMTAVLLIFGAVMAKTGKIQLHKLSMFSALVLGIFFLFAYVIYHSTVDSVRFGDVNFDGVLDAVELASVGMLRTFYLVILLSHILLSMIVIPLVLFAFYFALSKEFDKHVKIVKYTWPIWLYVSVTGVIVYFMISPYYQN